MHLIAELKKQKAQIDFVAQYKTTIESTISALQE
jgi:hypothetical protein